MHTLACGQVLLSGLKKGLGRVLFSVYVSWVDTRACSAPLTCLSSEASVLREQSLPEYTQVMALNVYCFAVLRGTVCLRVLIHSGDVRVTDSTHAPPHPALCSPFLLSCFVFLSLSSFCLFLYLPEPPGSHG